MTNENIYRVSHIDNNSRPFWVWDGKIHLREHGQLIRIVFKTRFFQFDIRECWEFIFQSRHEHSKKLFSPDHAVIVKQLRLEGITPTRMKLGAPWTEIIDAKYPEFLSGCGGYLQLRDRDRLALRVGDCR
ncbi:MAG: hypothetical protein B5766_08945 [Candidatus Lumbricidophila eiseniae]|uniref:Uncharacterized protein n=1 Tax=Candidatus Lumbricidiphila eiseniae TaxID=1969409 RepID=A0A2A6FQD3_9MICO|nr:MAG: hypothetical protein B5766_08945 [Candidatus Lumbricidophila eiseniae]